MCRNDFTNSIQELFNYYLLKDESIEVIGMYYSCNKWMTSFKLVKLTNEGLIDVYFDIEGSENSCKPDEVAEALFNKYYLNNYQKQPITGEMFNIQKDLDIEDKVKVVNSIIND